MVTWSTSLYHALSGRSRVGKVNATELLDGALELAERGYRVFPIGANKAPAVEGGHYAATTNPETVRAWVEAGRMKNIGLATGAVSGICVTDADTEEARDRLRAKYGPETVTSARGGHWYWKHPGAKVASKPLGGGVDSKADGGYVLAPPSRGKTWVDRVPLPAELPSIPDELLPKSRVVTTTAAIPEERFEAAVSALAANYPARGDQYEAGRHLAGYLMGNGVSREDGANLALEACSRAGYLEGSTEYNISRVFETTEAKLAAGEHVTGGPSLEEYVPGLPRLLAEALEWGAKDYPLTDAGNAERFADKFGADFRFVTEWQAWARYDGRRWVQMEESPSWAMVETVRQIHSDAARLEPEARDALQKFARASESGTRIRESVKLARGKLLVGVEDFDRDPYVLNVENGTVDLRTGTLRAHNRDDLMTKMAPVEFDPKAKATRFKRFMKQTLVDDELIAFVQRFLGYSLTGSTEERALAVLHGVGKNGKSTLVELFQDMLGDYAGVVAPSVVMQQRYSDSKGEYALAELKGKRFVSVSETKRGVELEEATVKQITGNDTISARAPYGRPFAYRPQFKLWMSTNHKPEIPDGSEAIWDRMRLIPFAQRFEGRGADPKLPEKLRGELSGVLAWAVEGCVAWFGGGLGTSAAVDAATAKYRSETDVLDRFFEDACEFGPGFKVGKKELFIAWERWCDAEGADPGTQTAFTRMVGERGVIRGFKEAKIKGMRVWTGVKLADKVPPDGESAPPKSPANSHFPEEGGHFGQDFQNFSTEGSHGEGLGKTEKSAPPAPSTKGLGLAVLRSEAEVDAAGEELTRVVEESKRGGEVDRI